MGDRQQEQQASDDDQCEKTQRHRPQIGVAAAGLKRGRPLDVRQDERFYRGPHLARRDRKPIKRGGFLVGRHVRHRRGSRGGPQFANGRIAPEPRGRRKIYPNRGAPRPGGAAPRPDGFVIFPIFRVPITRGDLSPRWTNSSSTPSASVACTRAGRFVAQRNPLGWSRWETHCRRTESTGHFACRITCSAVLPRRNRLSPVRPCVVRTIMSTSSFSAASRMPT